MNTVGKGAAQGHKELPEIDLKQKSELQVNLERIAILKKAIEKVKEKKRAKKELKRQKKHLFDSD